MSEENVIKLLDLINKSKNSVRFELNKNFEILYKVVVLSSKGNLRFIELSFDFFDSFFLKEKHEKLIYYENLIKILKNDKENLLESNPDFCTKLFRHYTELWCKLKDGVDQEVKISVQDLIKMKAELIQSIQEIKRPSKSISNPKNVITYSSLFLNTIHPQKVKDVLFENDYLNKDYSWKGITKKKDELAIAFYILRNEFKAIKIGEKKNQIICFYNEFGLKVRRQGETGGYCSYNNLSKEPKDTETIQQFKLLFAQLKS